jgi:WXG100 family type VII secretion target
MADNELRVTPTDLQTAASEFRSHHGDMRFEIARIHDGHSELQDSWTGAASKHIATAWDDLHPRLTAHADLLADHAQRLVDSARSYVATDDDTAESLAPQ